MKKRKQPQSQQRASIDIETYDCGSLPLYVQQALDEGRLPTEADLTEVLKYSSIQLSVQMRRLHRKEKAERLELYHNWEDCLGYALLLDVSEKAAEYNCPKKRWLAPVTAVLTA